MKVIVTANRKGGEGKTASAAALGAGLARKGARILFIDLDGQANLTWDTGADKTRPGAIDVLTGTAQAGAVIQRAGKWDVISPGKTIEAADVLIHGKGREYKLRAALEPLSAHYDYAIIDTPAQLGIVTISALTAANGVVIIAQPERNSIQGVALLYDIVRQIQLRSNPRLEIYGILVTRYKSRGVIHKDMYSNLQAVAEKIGTKVFKDPIRECLAIQEAADQRADIYTYSPRSNGARDYTAFVTEFLEDREGEKEE